MEGAARHPVSAALRAGLMKSNVAVASVAVLVVVALVGGITFISSHSSPAKATSGRTALIASPSAPASPAGAERPSASPTPSASPQPKKSMAAEAAGSTTHLDDPHPHLGVQAAPSWAKEPPMTTTLHSTKSLVDIYTYTKGVAPNSKSVLIQLNNPTLQGLQFTLAGFEEQDGYYLALLDVRPNNTFGWVKATDVTVSSTPYRIEISQSQHRLLLWKNDSVIGNFSVAVGKASTATPNGYSFVNTILKQTYAAGDYGPWIVSSSAFSEVYTTFGADGGDAAIGLHGSDEPTLIGQSVSHGCVRMFNSDITLMAATVPVGTLFEIHE